MDKLTLSPSAKKRYDSLQRATKTAQDRAYEFLQHCLSAMGIDLDDPNEKWDFDGKDTFSRVQEPNPDLPPVLDPALAGKKGPKTLRKSR